MALYFLKFSMYIPLGKVEHTLAFVPKLQLIKVYKIHEFERYASVCSIFSDAIYASKLAQVLWNFLYDLPVNLEHVIC